MRIESLHKYICVSICLVFVLSLSVSLFDFSASASSEEYLYNELYRNQLSYSPRTGWNNDPNGLVYADGVYHMYYQYSYNQDTETISNYWTDISWGHATSTDLVHWEEKEVAIPAYQTVDGEYYGMMFSGSAVYDEYNSSGLFDTEDSGCLTQGQGIVAVLTQPSDNAGGQRQILAYSKDYGTSFCIYGEILGVDQDGGLDDGEFRDPKVFWNSELDKWLMVVGGGSVRMYSSDNLMDWEYLGETGYWGECPDISFYEINGETKYVLIISPEDKENSHIYNNTSRSDTYYPSEYYVVGDLDRNGLFVGETELKRLSNGIDSYAFQSFNNVPDEKVYGISWAASWKTVSEYESLRENFNGGMTVVCEMNLEETEDGYVLKRTPVESLEDLRTGELLSYEGEASEADELFEDISALTGDMEIELDFSGNSSGTAEIYLRESNCEKILLKYDAGTGLLTLDRSESSLTAADTSLYRIPYSVSVWTDEEGVLSLRVLIDRASVSVFVNNGEMSFFSAVFPSAYSTGISVSGDSGVEVSAVIYATDSIYGDLPENENLYLSTNKIDTTIGSTEVVSASMLQDGFTNSDASYEVVEGEDIISMSVNSDATYITADAEGYAKIEVTASGITKTIDIYSYQNGFCSDLEYTMRWGGFSYLYNDGMFFSGDSDSFYFSDTWSENFSYEATFTPLTSSSQAGALVFGVSENLTSYYVVTADMTDKVLKLWQSGTGDLVTASYNFEEDQPFSIKVVMQDLVVRVYVNGSVYAAITYEITDYSGGYLGLNVYNGEFSINDVTFSDTDTGEYNAFNIGGEELLGILNVTDANAILLSGDYTYVDGVLTISEEYLLKLCGGTEYTFKVITEEGIFYFSITTTFKSVSVSLQESVCDPEDGVTLLLGRDTTVTSVWIDGTEYEFTQSGRQVIVSGENLSEFDSGVYYITVYTSNGRAETTVTFEVPDTTVQTNSKVISFVAVGVAVLIVAGTVSWYFLISRRKKATPGKS